MEVIIHRGSQEIGGNLIEIVHNKARIILDAGFPLMFDETDGFDESDILPPVTGLYHWDRPDIAGLIISHAHYDHYGLLPYIHPDIPIYVSSASQSLIRIQDKLFGQNSISHTFTGFEMYESFSLAGFEILPLLVDHSAFHAAAFQIQAGRKSLIYTGDFRGHGRKSWSLDTLIEKVDKSPDLLLIEGTTIGRKTRINLSEQDLENDLVQIVRGLKKPVFVQTSSQNIDRLVTLFRLARRTGKISLVDIYTAIILDELNKNSQGKYNLPHPSPDYPDLKVYFPASIKSKIIASYGQERIDSYIKYGMNKSWIKNKSEDLIMIVRPSVKKEIDLFELSSGLFIYSLWSGYRTEDYQADFENFLLARDFEIIEKHSSGHADYETIKKLIKDLNPQTITPIHTDSPTAFLDFGEKVEITSYIQL